MKTSTTASTSASVAKWYFNAIRHPIILLVGFSCFFLVSMSGIPQFRFDASSDTLVVAGDPRLLEYNRMSALFGADDFVVLTYSNENLFSDAALADISALQDRVRDLAGIRSTYSVLDAPLIESPHVPLDLIAENYLTLKEPGVDRSLAKIELTTSPLFSNYLISADGKTAAISGTLERDLMLEKLSAKRSSLAGVSTVEANKVEKAYAIQRSLHLEKRAVLIDSLRSIRDEHPRKAQIYISGVPMIAADMFSYVKSDLQIFGAMVLLLIITFLFIFFRKPRWVFIPLLICITSVATTMGILGLLMTPVTVVSSNFISLLSIISISFSIHLVVQYRELLAKGQSNHQQMVFTTMRSKFAPCMYTALTTLLAFGSMLASKIVPIIDFGWMMCLGIGIALIVTYVLFPTILLLIGPAGGSSTLGEPIRVAAWFQRLSTKRTNWVLAVALLLFIPGVLGVLQLKFDNRFVDYFGEETEIRKGMEQIDRHLGGTLPLDIYIKFEALETVEDDFFGLAEDPFPERYWYTPDKIQLLQTVETQLKERPEIGKVLSLASIEQLARDYNDDKPLSGLELSFLLGELPAVIREFLIDPFANPRLGWMRINARITESESVFSKQDLISDIELFLSSEIGLADDEYIVTGMVVLFSDMLEQLADSQLKTLGYVVGATFLMFTLLLRSLKLAIIALVPNILAALLILAFMGLSGIAMDMMTVTIATICIGIGVDDAIHYLHRFRKELQVAESTEQAVISSHQTIGRAMYFTTMTIMGGFSILAFSNFIPTVYFGLLTSLAMLLALIANMTLLPSLLMKFCAPPATLKFS